MTRGGRMGRRTLTALFGAALIVAVVGWYYSGQILGPDQPSGETGQRVLARTDSTITLTSTFKSRRPGYWAIVWPGGLGKIGPLISADDRIVVTHFEIATGVPPDTTSRLAGFAPKADPRTWLGVDFDAVEIPARVGRLPAWWIPGADSTWAILLHGRAATRAEVLRMLPAYRALGLPCLVVSYRNDPGAPKVGDGSYRLGATEWQDLEDAVRYARAHGARDVVVVGCSMGGAIVAQFLRRSAERSITRAAVLDAPALDWNAVVALSGKHRGVPPLVTEWGKVVASWRSGLDWNDLVQAGHAPEFSTPMLIFHGEEDATVPIEVSRRFAAARPDLVTFVATPGAGHVESANLNPERYASILDRWLRDRNVGHAAEPIAR